MRKISICLFLLFFCWTMVVGQQKDRSSDEIRVNKESRISKGSCYDVIEFLRTNQDTDSIAVEVFKDEYKIKNMPYRQREWLYKKNYIEIIDYFSRGENKQFHCKLDTFIDYDPVLLME